MTHMGDDDTGGIVRDLQLKVEFLDGWRVGESERYDRLERDLARLADEVASQRQESRAEFASVRGSIDTLRSEMIALVTRTHTEQRLILVLMLSGMFALWIRGGG